jgi:hypothetical protein
MRKIYKGIYCFDGGDCCGKEVNTDYCYPENGDNCDCIDPDYKPDIHSKERWQRFVLLISHLLMMENVMLTTIIKKDVMMGVIVAKKMSNAYQAKSQCQIELLFFPLHYFHSFRDGLGVKKSNFFFYK